jgi:hypothetical protein
VPLQSSRSFLFISNTFLNIAMYFIKNWQYIAASGKLEKARLAACVAIGGLASLASNVQFADGGRAGFLIGHDSR